MTIKPEINMPRFFLTIITLFFATCLVTAQHSLYNKTNLEIDYESTVINFLPQTQEMLELLLGKVLETEDIMYIDIIAVADNRDLSEERIGPILDFFEQHKIAADKIEAVTEYSDKHQIHIIISSVLKEKKEHPLVQVRDSLSDQPAQKQYCAGGSKKAQVFEIHSASSILTVKGEEGTEIQIKREDLVHQNGEAVEGAIKVELKEFYSNADILMAELHTLDGNKVLETAGMLNLNITAQNKPLKLRQGKSANIKMPAKSSKYKKGMDLYMGNSMADGAIDWKRETRNGMVTTTVGSESFKTSSYVRLKKREVVDSISYINFRSKKNKNNITGNNPMARREIIKHSHQEEYFDLELPYIPTPSPVSKRKSRGGGIWINLDRYFSIDIELPSMDPPPPPSVDILVEVKGMPKTKMSKDGYLVANAPKVVLMLKNRAVFLRGKFLQTGFEIGDSKLIFERVPLGQEAVLVAFLDIGDKVLFATQELSTEKKVSLQSLEMKIIDKASFQDSMAGF
jgi:hypothetical protein